MNDILQKLRDPSGGSDSHEVCDICGIFLENKLPFAMIMV
jgi:hypothetical protein